MVYAHLLGRRVTQEEWMIAIDFLTRTGQACTPTRHRQEFIQLSNVLGVAALLDALNNPQVGTATESSLLGPFFTEDAPDRASCFRFCVNGPSRSPRSDFPRHAHPYSTCSPTQRVDRIRGEGRVHVCRGIRTRYQRRAYSWRGHRDVGGGRQG